MHAGTQFVEPDRSGPSAGPTDLSVVCRVGSCLCALPVAHVDETMRPLPVEPLAGTHPFILGVAIIRGVPTPVVDAGLLLGAGAVPSPKRFVALRVAERRVALAVDAVVGVRALPADSLAALPPLLQDAGTVSAIGTLDSGLLLVLRGGRIVPESMWALLDGGAE